jgi:hypothetical protein
MGNMEIVFRYNKKTGKKEIIFDLEADDELMRHEHEKKHRDIVRQVVGDDVEIERLEPGSEIPALEKNAQQEPEALTNEE